MDKKTSKKIDEAVSKIRIAIYDASLSITDEIQRELETRLIQTIHDRWEYMDRLKEKRTSEPSRTQVVRGRNNLNQERK